LWEGCSGQWCDSRNASQPVRFWSGYVSGRPLATIVFQRFALFPWLTVQENVDVALKARGMPARLRPARALDLLDLLDRVGLDGFENAYPRELSGGMRQKVGFARAMAVEPELPCMDPQVGLRRFMSMRAAITSRLRPFGPRFFGTVDENSRRYFRAVSAR